MDLFEVEKKRRSIRKFKPNPILKEDLRKILQGVIRCSIRALSKGL
ncbi:nitroreductase family protein [Candidatus Bathyarchaeota archaeon]|nr:nitroreductase family protein [Candidatus Bathyarchaeota archaeon]